MPLKVHFSRNFPPQNVPCRISPARKRPRIQALLHFPLKGIEKWEMDYKLRTFLRVGLARIPPSSLALALHLLLLPFR